MKAKTRPSECSIDGSRTNEYCDGCDVMTTGHCCAVDLVKAARLRASADAEQDGPERDDING